jgi:hypothetical protein
MSNVESHLGLADYISGQGADCGVLDISEEVLHSDLLCFSLTNSSGQVNKNLLRLLSTLRLDLLLCNVRMHW